MPAVVVQLIIAVAIVVIVALVCKFVGRMVARTGAAAPPLATAGGFFDEFAWVIGLVAGVLWFVLGGKL